MSLADFRKWDLRISANEPYVRSRVHKLACISIAGMAAEDAQMGSVVTSRASAPFPCRPGLDMWPTLEFFFSRAALVWICEQHLHFLLYLFFLFDTEKS